MQLVAVITHADGTVAPVDDTSRNFQGVSLYQFDKNGAAPANFPFDPAARDFDLGKALALSHATDVIGQHFEEGCFNKLKSLGVRLWLEAPGLTAREALSALFEGKLPEATVGAHAIHGPEGRRVRNESVRERHPAHSAPGRGVSSPVQSGKLPF